jgi:ABC-type lipoprotein release transport system permease subunit
LLFGVQRIDLFSVAATLAIIAIVLIAAGLFPALRAARVSPLVAIRYE